VVIGTMRRLFRKLAGAAVLTLSLLPAPARAVTVQIDFVDTRIQYPPGSEVYIFRADLAASGLGSVESITIEDLGTGLTGAKGIFTGFDLDAIFLDVDGDPATAHDRFFATGYQFAAGDISSSDVKTAHSPSKSRPGPVFGSDSDTTINHALATLDEFDAVSIANVSEAKGFLSLGKGGILTLLFDTPVPVGPSLYLIAGEVGGNGETLRAATVTGLPPAHVPGPAALPLLATALGLFGLTRLRRGSGRRARPRTASASRA
jgi:hypothetical protein